MEPSYQRRGGIWTMERRQLLIDSIINEYDIPKLYFHHILPWYPRDRFDSKHKYAVIDGRQRLSAILDFLDDKFPLADDFKYFEDDSVDAAGMHYSAMSSKYPRLKVIFDSFTLPITLVETDELDLIEDMFSRLNEASPLSSAEKRNSLGGPMAQAIRDIALHTFIADKTRISNKRFQHREVAARLLFVEDSLRTHRKVIDTKRPYLDEMVERYHAPELAQECIHIRQAVQGVLDVIAPVFRASDPLLSSQAFTLPLYLVYRQGFDGHPTPDRARYEAFRITLSKNRHVAEHRLPDANFEFLEFDRMSQQGTNDASSITTRAKILRSYLLGELNAEEASVHEAYGRLAYDVERERDVQTSVLEP